jgi:hypothetical protein
LKQTDWDKIEVVKYFQLYDGKSWKNVSLEQFVADYDQNLKISDLFQDAKVVIDLKVNLDLTQDEKALLQSVHGNNQTVSIDLGNIASVLNPYIKLLETSDPIDINQKFSFYSDVFPLSIVHRYEANFATLISKAQSIPDCDTLFTKCLSLNNLLSLIVISNYIYISQQLSPNRFDPKDFLVNTKKSTISAFEVMLSGGDYTYKDRQHNKNNNEKRLPVIFNNSTGQFEITGR